MMAVEQLDPASSGKSHPTIVLGHYFSECAIINELRLIHIDILGLGYIKAYSYSSVKYQDVISINIAKP